ncbi:MAG: SIMPL domain-containing protein [Bacteroidota bacterium]
MKQFFFATCFLFVAFTAIAQTEKPYYINPFPKTITVTGSAAMEVTPDQIFVEVYLREYKKKGEEKTTLDKIKIDFLNLCKNVGISDSNIVVSDYEGFNNYFYFKRSKRQNPDLYAAIRYVVKFSDLVKLNALADGLDDEAIQSFDIVNVTHSKITEYRKQMKIAAIKAAKDKAIYLTEAINEKLGEAITINEPNDAGADFQGENYLNRKLSNGKKETNVSFFNDQVDKIDYKKIKIRFEVEILFALK